MQDKKAELEQRRQKLTARRGLVLDPSGIDKELETINKELAAMDKSSATKVGSAPVKPKDGRVKLESKGQDDTNKIESKGKDDDLALEEDLKGITLEDQLHEEEVIDLKKAIEGIDKLIGSKDYEKARIEIKKALQFCYKGINKGKYATDEYELFLRLGDIYLHHGEIYDVPKAAAIYQYVKKLVEKHLNSNSAKLKDIEARIQSAKPVFLKRIKAPTSDLKAREESTTEVSIYREELLKFREVIKERLAKIEDLGIEKDKEELNEDGLKERAQAVEAIYGEIREFFIGKRSASGELEKPRIVNRLINDCIRELGGLPRVGADEHECGYSIFGMGSLALGTMTPWSDLEFGILIEEGLPKEEEDRVKEYFRQLTTLLHIKVVNFGETPLRMMGVAELNNFKVTEKSDAEHNWFFDDLTKSGFSFDGPHWHACKTPLGRAKGYHKARVKESGTELVPCVPYELIGTAREFADFYQGTTWVKEDPQLVQGLGHIVLISGRDSLILQYQDMLRGQREVIESLAFKLLKEDSQALDPFNQMSEDREGSILNVKKDLYRLPDRIIVSIGDCLNGKGRNSWEVLRSLKEGIGAKRVIDLELASSIATEMRLRTYDNNNGQREDLTAIERYESQIKELREIDVTEQVFCLKDARLLYKYYEIVMRLGCQIKSVGNKESLVGIGELLTVEEGLIFKGMTYFRFSRYMKAITEFEKALLQYEKDAVKLGILNQMYILALLCLANAHSKMSNYDKSLLYYTKANGLLKDLGMNSFLIFTLNNIGNIYNKQNKYNEAIAVLKKVLIAKKEIIGNKVPSNDNLGPLATTHLNLGISYRSLMQYTLALEHYFEALKIYLTMYGWYNLKIADCYNNIANVYISLGDYQQALVYHKKALAIEIRCFTIVHESVIESLLNLGVVYRALGNIDLAIEHYLEAIRISQLLFGGVHILSAKSFFNLGNAYCAFDNPQPKKAISCYQKCAEIYEKIFGRENTKTAQAYYNLGCAYAMLGDFQQAIQNQRCAYEIYVKVIGENNPIARMTLESIDQFKKQLVLVQAKESLAKYRGVLDNKSDKEILDGSITTDQYLGALLYKKLFGEGERSAEKLKRTEISQDEMNVLLQSAAKLPQAARVPLNSDELNQKGIEHFRNKNYSESVKMFSKLINLSPIAGYHYNRGRAYHENGNYDEAVMDYEEALKLEPSHLKARSQLEQITKIKEEQARLNKILSECLEMVGNKQARLDGILNQVLENLGTKQTDVVMTTKIKLGKTEDILEKEQHAAIKIQCSWRRYVQARRVANSTLGTEATALQ